MVIPPFISNLFTGGLAKIGDSVKNIIDESKFSAEEKAELQFKVTTAFQAHELELTKIANEEAEAYLKDVDSARQMQIQALKQDDKFSKRFIYYLASVVIILVFGFDFCLFWVKYPQENRDMINFLSGILNSTALVMVLSFFFGSSMGSKHASENQAEQMKKLIEDK